MSTRIQVVIFKLAAYFKIIKTVFFFNIQLLLAIKHSNKCFGINLQNTELHYYIVSFFILLLFFFLYIVYFITGKLGRTEHF